MQKNRLPKKAKGQKNIKMNFFGRHAVSLAFALFLLFACGKQREREDSPSASMQEVSAAEIISSSAAVEKGGDSTRRFIRTAELKFRVKDVAKATYRIEELTNRLGGFVAYTQLNSREDWVTTTPISADSILEMTHFTVENTMKLRVPNTKLDTVLRALVPLIDYLDYRIIKADDVALELLQNRLTQQRVAKNERRLTNAIESKGSKLGETTKAEALLLSKQEQADDAKIAMLSLQDQIKFSTITLLVYQRQTVKKEYLANNDTVVEPYSPSLGGRLLNAIKSGWDILEDIIVFVAQLWAVFLLAIVAYIIYRTFKKNKK